MKQQITKTTETLPTVTAQIDQLKNLVSDALVLAKQNGATACEVGASIQSGLETTVRMREVDTVSFHRDKGFGITVYMGKSKGNASTSDTTSASIKETVAAACAIAKHTAADEYAGLADKADMAHDIVDLDLHHPWDLPPEEAIALASECEASGLAYNDKVTNSEGASVNTHQGVSVYGNTHGFLEGYAKSRHSMSCVLIGEQDKVKQRDYWYTVSRCSDQLLSAKTVGETAAKRTSDRLGARKIATCSAPVIFEAKLASSLFSTFLAAISGGHLYRKTSFLCDTLNKKVFADHISMIEAPLLPRGLASAPFDDEGVQTKERDIVTEGVLQGYVLSSYSARRLGLKTTGNAGGVHNILVKTGSQDLPDLLKTMHRGLLVTELIGQGINLVTGDYSRGAAGFWVENGKIQYPVEEITIAGRLQDMFQDIQAVGKDVDNRSPILTGSVLVGQMMVGGS